jgi:ribosomal protein S18 acetylase RimI-like enzyme
MINLLRWKPVKLGAGEKANNAVKMFLQSMEPYSVSAYSRFVSKISDSDRAWAFFEKGRMRDLAADANAVGTCGAISGVCITDSAKVGGGANRASDRAEKVCAVSGLIVQSGRTLFPVFTENSGGKTILPFLSVDGLYAVQGIGGDVEFLEESLLRRGVRPKERVLYDMMVIDRAPSAASLGAGPPGLIIRQAGKGDMEALFQLQQGYEKEEVLQRDATFDPSVCRLNIERIAAHEQLLLAELGGQVCGKINTGAASPSFFQIGGVYVHPDYRGRGIASKMAAVFVQGLLGQGKTVSLFVKKRNAAARAAYARVGFASLGEYRISYY